MNALEVSQRSTDAWNRHDADALVAVYAEGGTYHNPRLDHALTGQAIGDFAKSVWAAYPDMSLEIISREKDSRATTKRVNGPKRRGQNGKSAISASKRADLNGVFRADVVSTRISPTMFPIPAFKQPGNPREPWSAYRES